VTPHLSAHGTFPNTVPDLPSGLTTEPRRWQASGLRAQTEAMLRELAFVYRVTDSVRQSISENASPSKRHSDWN
jgi:hypothetical protein